MNGETRQNSLPEGVKALKICIIGAGMGGLASALALAKQGFEDIQVYETASNLGFVGAGIQLAPNMARILDRLGCWSDIEKEAVIIRDTSIRQGAGDTQLGYVELGPIKEMYGYHHMVGHRAHLAGGLYKGCQEEKAIKFHFSTSIELITSFAPTPSFRVIPRNGDPYVVEADVLLGADGIKSKTRVALLKEIGVHAEVKDTQQAAYRIMLTRKEMEHDPELLELLDSDRITRWIGPKKHIIAYPIDRKNIYNLSTCQPDTNFAIAPSETYTTKGSKSAMLEVFKDFSPRVQRMLNLVPEGEVCEWKLRVHAPLPTWIHGSVALVGDACHPTLPHLNQGAAQAIEDGATIGVALGRLQDHSPTSINKALRIYEMVRKDRAETLVELAAASGRTLHLGEGKAKEERDKALASATGKSGGVPDKWADSDVQKTIYGFDCMKVAEEMFDSHFDTMLPAPVYAQ